LNECGCLLSRTVRGRRGDRPGWHGGIGRGSGRQKGERLAFWSNKSTSDVYVALRHIAQVQKSPSTSRVCGYAWVGPPPGGRDEDDRMIDRWRRRNLITPAGQGCCRFGRDPRTSPTSPPMTKRSDVVWVPMPAGKAAGNPPRPSHSRPRLRRTTSGSHSRLCSSSGRQPSHDHPGQCHRPRAGQNDWLEEHRQAGLLRLKSEAERRVEIGSGMRMALFGNDGTGLRWVWDLAADPSAYSSESDAPDAQDWPEVQRPVPSGSDRPLLGVDVARRLGLQVRRTRDR
jgi:hypothetical protein